MRINGYVNIWLLNSSPGTMGVDIENIDECRFHLELIFNTVFLFDESKKKW